MEETFINEAAVRRRVRWWLVVFVLGLGFSLQMVLFVEVEIRWFKETFGAGTRMGEWFPEWADWLGTLESNIIEAYAKYPVIVYCMDYLVFAHLVLIVAFLGAVWKPVKNMWVVEFGLIGCLMMVPFAMVLGHLRGVPWFWRFVDSSFAILGLRILAFAYHGIRKLERKGGIVL